MKKAISALFIAVLLLLLCSCSSSSLPSGRASEVRIQNNASVWDLGSGEFEYINESTIKFVRDWDKKTYYLSTETLICIIKEE